MTVLSKRAFAAVIRAGDSRRFAVDLKKSREAIISDAVNIASLRPASLPKFHATNIRGKACVSYSDFPTHLILRSIARHLQQRYRVKLPNRERMIRGVIESLLDSTPMYVLRRDISSFYETVPISPLRDKLLDHSASPAQVRDFIRAFFEQHCSHHPHGLPRGVGLSAILAEIAMDHFDQTIRQIPGVYKYYRYSDDILIFSFLPSEQVAKAVTDCLPQPMKFNRKKSFDLPLTCSDEKIAAQKTFEYLGYHFSTSDLCGGKDSRKVTVSISDKKVRRLKTRVILSLREHAERPNYDLLRNRIRFLTSNYAVRRHGVSHLPASAYVMSGIYFNYRLAGTYEFKGRQYEHTPHSAEELKKLDGFLNGLIKGHSSPFSKNLSTLQKAELSRLSFFQGFDKKIVVRYKAERIHEIKRAWLRHD